MKEAVSLSCMAERKSPLLNESKSNSSSGNDFQSLRVLAIKVFHPGIIVS